MEHWVKCYEKCPLCGSIETEYNIMKVLTSCPPQYSFRCKCGHNWSGVFESYLTPTPVYDFQKETNGSYGWICPVCGAGVSPYQDHCPVCSRESLTPTWTCGSGSISSDGVGNYQLYNSNTESNVGVFATKVSTTINKTDAELLIDTTNEIKNNIRKQDKNDRSK